MKISRSIRQNAGLSLMELLLATIVTGLVMFGIVAFSSSISRIQDTTYKSNNLSMRMTAAMAYLRRDAFKAVGDAWNTGVYSNVAGSNMSLCFRHDTNDPTSYSDDRWVCYDRGADNRILRCELALAPANSPNNCTPPRNPTFIIEVTNPVFYRVECPAAQPCADLRRVSDFENHVSYVEFTITSRFDPSLAAHSMTNPELTMSTRVTPQAHSR